ncbi:MAG: hypothetical protein Q9169_005244 [Polycauliona sp. 2 TL-2023]
MDTTDLTSLLEILDDDIDELEETLAPVTKHALGDTVSKLPLLDKAQLYILVTYAIESILFSYLRLNGVDAKEHAVFTELKRVKQYFQKVEDVEKIGSRRENLSLDKAAAGRIVRHALVSHANIILESTFGPRLRTLKSSHDPTVKLGETRFHHGYHSSRWKLDVHFGIGEHCV